MSSMARMSSSVSRSILFTSCEVRKPSKKCRNGTRHLSVAAWAIMAMSCTSATVAEQSMAQPVCRQAITSPWSPKIDRAWVARRPGRDVEHRGRQFACDLVHVGDHQQQTPATP